MIGEQAPAFATNIVVELVASGSATVQFKADELRTRTGVLTGATYTWNWGDGSPEESGNAAGGYNERTKYWPNPGRYRLRLTITIASAVFEICERTIIVGLDATAITASGDANLTHFASFEAVVVVRLHNPDTGSLLVVVPLLAASKPYDPPTISGGAVQPTSAALLDLAGRLQSVYAHRALMLPVPEDAALPDGLYLLFPRDVVYAGTSPALATLQQKLRRDWRQIDLEESLHDLRVWALAEAAFANTSGLAYANAAGDVAALPAIIEPSMGARWLAPGLGGFAYDEALAGAAAQDIVVPNMTLAQGQSVVSPLQEAPRQQALRWLLTVGSGLTSVVRKFGEERKKRFTNGPVDYPASLFAWNTHDATLAWSVIGQSDKAGEDEEDPRIEVQNYWAHGAMTFGLSREDAEHHVPDLDALNLVCTCKARQVLGDAAVRAMVGEDRELGDHVVVHAGRTYGVRMRTGEVFLPSGPKSETVPGSVHVVGRFWAGLPDLYYVAADPPFLRMPSMAEAMTGEVPDMDQSLIGRVVVPTVGTYSGLQLDETTGTTAAAVARYRLRRGGELRQVTRAGSTAVVCTLGPTALSQLDRTTDEVAPLRNPLRNVTGGGGGCGGGCGG
jgi:hypothetical protein